MISKKNKWILSIFIISLVLTLTFYFWWCLSYSIVPLPKLVETSTGTYGLLKELPIARTEAGGTVNNGKMIITGGINSFAQTYTNTMIYNIETDEWSNGPDLPEPINHPSLISYGDTVYIIGGFGPLGLRLRWFMFARWDALSTVYKLHVPTGTITKGADLPFPRGAGGATLIDSTIWYVGGIDEHREITNSVFCLRLF